MQFPSSLFRLCRRRAELEAQRQQDEEQRQLKLLSANALRDCADLVRPVACRVACACHRVWSLLQIKKLTADSTKQPITEAFNSLETFLKQPKLNAAQYLPGLNTEGVQLWQLPSLTPQELQTYCKIPWSDAARILAIAGRYAAD